MACPPPHPPPARGLREGMGACRTRDPGTRRPARVCQWWRWSQHLGDDIAPSRWVRRRHVPALPTWACSPSAAAVWGSDTRRGGKPRRGGTLPPPVGGCDCRLLEQPHHCGARPAYPDLSEVRTGLASVRGYYLPRTPHRPSALTVVCLSPTPSCLSPGVYLVPPLLFSQSTPAAGLATSPLSLAVTHNG